MLSLVCYVLGNIDLANGLAPLPGAEPCLGWCWSVFKWVFFTFVGKMSQNNMQQSALNINELSK